MEKLERRLATLNVAGAVRTIYELEARFDSMEDGKLDTKYPGLLDLLALAADPESGVIVEFAPRGNPTVLITWGSLPLAMADVSESPSAEAAVKLLESPDGEQATGRVKTTIGGLPAVVYTRRSFSRPSGPGAYDPNRRIICAYPQDRQAWMGDLDLLNRVGGIEAVAVLPGCPTAIREAVQAWARKSNAALTDIETALTKRRIIVAGDVSGSKFADDLKTYWVRSAYDIEGFGGLSIVKGKRVIHVQAPTRKVAERAAELIASGQPITRADVDSLRAWLVEERAPKAAPDASPPEGGLFCGDVHLHTFYSDGIASPVELVLQGMYANLDFMVITDHDRIDGARLGRRLLAEYGVDYPVIVGEEISIEKGAIHACAYPLKECIGPISLEEVLKAAHSQAAVIQWNHPPWPGSDWAFKHVNSGTVGTGFDAWEHYSDDFGRWEARGIMPVVVGSTDNHSIQFGSWCERTAIIAPSAEGGDLADAIRDRRAALVAPMRSGYLYGPEETPSWVWQMMADGPSLKQAQAERIRRALQNADIVGLLRASPPSKPN